MGGGVEAEWKVSDSVVLVKERKWFIRKDRLSSDYWQSPGTVYTEINTQRYLFWIGLGWNDWRWGIETRGASIALYLGPLRGFVDWFFD